MSITSIFIPNSTSFINNPYYLENLLTTCQTKFKSYDQSAIISLSYVINTVDNLSVLNFLINKKNTSSLLDTIYFYWENKVNNEEVLGYGATQYFDIDSSNRFSISKKFTKDCLAKIIKIKEKKEIKASPRIFSGFTFFDKTDYLYCSFPPAFAFLPYVQLIKTKNSSTLTYVLTIQIVMSLQLIMGKINALSELALSDYLVLKARNS